MFPKSADVDEASEVGDAMASDIGISNPLLTLLAQQTGTLQTASKSGGSSADVGVVRWDGWTSEMWDMCNIGRAVWRPDTMVDIAAESRWYSTVHGHEQPTEGPM